MDATYTFDSVNGSDTAASGYAQDAGLAATAVYGNQGSYSTVTSAFSIAADYPGTYPNIQVGDKIWIETGSGRQWFTVNDVSPAGSNTFSFNESISSNLSGLTWGCGGSRKTFQGSSQLFADIEAGETILGQPLSTSGQTQTLSSTISITAAGTTANGPITINGNGVTLTSATNNVNLLTLASGWARLQIENFAFTHTATTRGYGVYLTSSAGSGTVMLSGCTFNGCSQAFVSNTSTVPFFLNCEVKNCTLSSSSNGTIYAAGIAAVGLWVHSNPNCCGIWIPLGSYPITLDSCVISDNGHDGIASSTALAAGVQITCCTFVKNGGSHINFSSTGLTTMLAVYDNIFYGAGAYGISLGTATATLEGLLQICDYNAYGANTSGNYSTTAAAGVHDVAGVPSTIFNNYSGDDYTLSQAGAANAGILNVGFPLAVMGQASKSAMGAEQMQPAASGGGGSSRMGISI